MKQQLSIEQQRFITKKQVERRRLVAKKHKWNGDGSSPNHKTTQYENNLSLNYIYIFNIGSMPIIMATSRRCSICAFWRRAVAVPLKAVAVPRAVSAPLKAAPCFLFQPRKQKCHAFAVIMAARVAIGFVHRFV